jgi:hypothetical protein
MRRGSCGWLVLLGALVLSSAACTGAGREALTDGLVYADGSQDAQAEEVAPPEVTDLGRPDPEVCQFTTDGTLKGVSIDLSGNPCVFTLAQAAAGITFHYRVLAEVELHDVESRPMDAGLCDAPGPSGLRLFEKIHGSGQTWCICDEGLCFYEPQPFTLMPGEYAESFQWHGRNWNGPSDTGNPEGQPFPPGEYTLVVRGEGKHGPLQADYAVTGTMKVILVEE